LVGAENSIGEPQYMKTEDQSNDGQSLLLSKVGSVRRKTASTPEDGMHRPVSVVTVLFRHVHFITI
jgi:hypothetical protein